MKRVYVIDDDLVLQKILKRMLMNFHESIEVSCFDDGSLGIAGLNTNKDWPDLIFLDINMPEMNAWQFIDAYEKHKFPENIPIYILSSSIDQRDIDRAHSLGLIKEYLVKPMKKDELHRICKLELQIAI